MHDVSDEEDHVREVVEMAAMLPLRMWMVQTIKMLIERLVKMTEWLQLGL